MSALANAPINLLSIREAAKKELAEVLDTIRGKKALVLDPALSGPLGLVAEKSLLKEHGVEKTYHLLPEPLDVESRSIMYIVRPKIPLMKQIAAQIHAHTKDKKRKEYHIYLVPRRTIICERVLEEEGVYGDVTLGEYRLDLIPFDDDVLSLELGDSFRECFLHGDRTSLFYVAKSIMKLQTMFGVIPRVMGKGSCSKVVYDMLVRMKREMAIEELGVTPEIDTLILLDRDIDMVTPMLTQLTYEGMIDEVYKINNGIVELDASIVGPQGQQQGANAPKKMRLPLNCNDKLHAELRDLNFTAVGPALKRRAMTLHEIEQERHKLQEKQVSQIKDYVKKLKDMNIQQEKSLLGLHTNLASEIGQLIRESVFNRRLEAEQNLLEGREGRVGDYIEECMYTQEPLVKVLRLLCLLSLLNNGIKKFDFYRRELLQSYGYESLFTLCNLEKLGLIKKQEGRATFPALRKGLRLLVEDVSELNPNDIAYVYSGYAPLSVRLVQHAMVPQGWSHIEESLRLLPGPHFDEHQGMHPATSSSVRDPAATRSPRRVTLVFFIGGCTFTELSALRFLGRKEAESMGDDARDYLFATTKLINGDTLLESVFEQVENGLVSTKRK